MFLLNETLKAKIYSRIKSELTFCPIEQVCFEEVCACKGSCGTYTPPCSCCAYD